jgi:hypothetical protein
VLPANRDSRNQWIAEKQTGDREDLCCSSKQEYGGSSGRVTNRTAVITLYFGAGYMHAVSARANELSSPKGKSFNETAG